MKLVLILIISITAAFAQNIDQNTKKAEEMILKSSYRVKRKAKGLKRILNKATHDFQTEKMISNSEKKLRRKFKVIQSKLLFVVIGKTVRWLFL